tara:strand:+ start:2627 stop:3064 length:438 start_codon:yes stop_codon:yes gene_type:complete
MILTEHFSLHEFTRSQVAARKKIKNTPDMATIERMRRLCHYVLEPCRQHFKSPVIITSGYRSTYLNRAIGGAKGSQHVLGEAADIWVVGKTNREVFEWIFKNVEFDQLIYEYPGSSGWVHVSYTAGDNRQEALVYDGRKYDTWPS